MSTKKNFAWNIVLTACNYIFPLITFPYVSRVLGVSNIGVCSYVDGIINYFVIFSMLGVGSLGVREVARIKENTKKLQVVFSSLITLLFLLTIGATSILVILSLNLEAFAPYKQFLWIGIIKLVFSALSITWFFQGISNFRYITVTSVVIRFLYVVSVLLFVKESSDTIVYYFLTCITVVLSTLVNWNFAGHFVKYRFRSVHLGMFLAPVISYGMYQIMTSMYTCFNTVFLGYVSNSEQVGFFSTATKLYTILISVFTAFTAVMIPRVSELLGKNDETHLRTIANETFQLIFSFSIPIIIVCYFFAGIIISIIAGVGYEGAITPFRIVMLLLLIIATNQIVTQQFLMAVRKSKCILIISMTGAFLGITLNLVLTPKLLAVGAAISWTATEFLALLMGLYFFNRYFKIKFPIIKLGQYLIASLPYLIVCWCFASEIELAKFIVALILCAIWFLVLNIYLIKNNTVVSLVQNGKLKLISIISIKKHN